MSKPLPNDQIELTNYFTPCYNTLRWCKPQAAVAQSVERRIGSAEVTGPIPVSSLKKPLIFKGFFFCFWLCAKLITWVYFK